MELDQQELRAWLRAICNDNSSKGPFADWLEDRGDSRATVVRGRFFVLWDQPTSLFPEAYSIPMLAGEDWNEAFRWAGNRTATKELAPVPERVPPNSDVSIAPFLAFDVSELLASVVGENNGDDWMAIGKLHDGRWFALVAGCDYTG